ncbi:YidC/Oxa1 family membrane protein insertase [Treponema maltophilum ATCC 51939]|uniref:Membrane protein insertase YidC n=1 Tax=Treponema maltophilum ATCC 51939 TaxID=1125699 RepID=S3K3F9_TREMA|nr:membrane protein insertase YidC [Treponema maltophilum]EPF32050.1 YidC/Oxa1 family membrane protein insertase [Treponema maltophilum ATCC 51939]
MDKNTIWAIVLSSLVLFASFFIQSKFFSKPQPAENTEVQSQTLQNTANTPSAVNAAQGSDSMRLSAADSAEEPVEDEDAAGEEVLEEREYVIETKTIKVRFTNRGGDIIGYELKDHSDGGKPVQMAKNISPTNRAFALAFGGSANAIVNDLFNAKIIDDRTIGFYKKFSVTNSTGGQDSFTLVKQYTFDPEEYVFKLDITIDGAKNMNGLAFGDAAYTLRSSPQIGPYYNPKVDRYERRTFIFYTKEKVKKLNLSNGQVKVYDKGFNWAGVAGKYFVQQVIPLTSSAIQSASYSTKNEVDNFQDAQLLLVRAPVSGSFAQDSYYVYMGPKVEKNLGIYNNAAENNWKLSNLKLDEALGSGWLSWLETFLKFLMEFFYKLIPNWGVSIILMTILLKVAMFPLTKKSSVSTLKMQELQPRIKEIQDKYKNNPEKMNAEMGKFYKEAGYNPLSGCLPLLIQFPLIFAMFNLFNNYFEFRGAMFIPGWIPDLSVGDSIYIFPSTIPLIGGSALRLLPIIYVASQLLFTKITQTASANAAGGNSMKLMMYGMPLFFFFMFYSAPAGLLLYWTVSNFLQLIQQMFINKMMHAKRVEMGLAEENKKPVLKKRKK